MRVRIAGKPARIGRPSKAEPFRADVARWLDDEPAVPSAEMLRRAKSLGYRGGKSAFYELVREVRVVVPGPITLVQPLPGAVTQHDSGWVQVQFGDGASRRIHFVASRLAFSRWSVISITADDSTETVIDALLRQFDQIGGIPLLAVFDRPGAVARSGGAQTGTPKWHPAIAALALDLGLGLEIRWRHRNSPFGTTDSLGGWVKSAFFHDRQFADPDDLDRQLAAWLGDINARRSTRSAGGVPSERLAADRLRLRPLHGNLTHFPESLRRFSG